jgi:hypothetical protein
MGMGGAQMDYWDNTSDINPAEIEAETLNQTRLELLSRQYVAGELSPEEKTRLAIVTERVRRLIPRATVEDFEMLEQILQKAAKIEAEDIERRRRLRIEKE